LHPPPPPHPFVSQKKHQKIREKKGQKEERKKERKKHGSYGKQVRRYVANAPGWRHFSTNITEFYFATKSYKLINTLGLASPLLARSQVNWIQFANRAQLLPKNKSIDKIKLTALLSNNLGILLFNISFNILAAKGTVSEITFKEPCN
jgi:hypothetical protein